MSSRTTVRIPISIPERLQDKHYTIKIAFHPIQHNGSMFNDMAVFSEETLTPKDLEGSGPDAKMLVLNRRDIPGFARNDKWTEAVGAKVCESHMGIRLI
jgi:hypothetical protein